MIIDEPTETLPEPVMIEESPIASRRYKALLIIGIVLPLMLRAYLGQLILIYDMSSLQRIIISEVLQWVTVGLLFLYAWRAEGNNFLFWQEKIYSPLFYAGSIIILFLMSMGSGVISRIPFMLGFHEDNTVATRMMTMLSHYPLLIAGTCITAGVTEELIFRGYILSRLSLFFKNQHWPVIISALIFASVHLAYKTVHEILFVLGIGLIFGYYYQRYKNLAVLMIVHFAIDFFAFSSYHPHK